MIRLAALLILGLALIAGEPSPSPAVATIDGSPVTLRELEDVLLKKEGADLVEEWVHGQLQGLDFAKLQDDDVILAIGFNKITRREIADSLLRKGVGKVRDELINIRLVEAAIAEAGITVGPEQLDATWERMRKRFEEKIADGGDTRIDFVNYLQVKEKMTPEQFRAQAGFRMLAGLQALVHHRAKDEWDDPALRAWFDANKARWHRTEAVDLAVIAIPYNREPGPDGLPVVTAAERERLMQVMVSLYRQLSSKDPKALGFARTWALYGKSWDPETRDGGHVGFVERSGRRDGATGTTRILGAELMAAAWNVAVFPTLLPPIASDWGVELAEVRGRRAAREPVYEDLRERVKADRIDETLEQRTEAVLKGLRTKAKIEYASLPDLINGRR